MEKIIAVDHLVKHFGKTKAVEDISFDVYKGDVFGFLGPNGAGKSTTIRILLSLIRPTGGEVKLFNRSLAKDRSYILRRIGCIVEKPDFYKYLSAEKNLEVLARISGAGTGRRRIHEMIEFVGLKGREKDKLAGFSHGMRQRLGLAQALLHDPELVVLDEPTTGLDPQGIIDIRNLILRLRSEQGKTVLLSSHILSEIELIANRMVIISKGRTIVQGSVTELMNREELIVSIAVGNVPRALELIEKAGMKNHISGRGEEDVQLHVSHDKIPGLNKLLCDNGVEVFGIEAKRKLEDYFLKLVNH